MNTTLDLDYIKGIIKNHKENSICGRWIRLSDVEKILSKFEDLSNFSSRIIGVSEESRNIHEVTFGKGPKKKYLFGHKCMEMKAQEQKL